MPNLVISTDTPGITFHGNADGVTYTTQDSTDLRSWTTGGVTVTSPDAQGSRAATVATGMGIPLRFIRLLEGC